MYQFPAAYSTSRASVWLLATLVAMLLSAFAIAIFPEAPGRSLTPPDGWVLNGSASSRVSVRAFPDQFRQTRRSVVESDDGYVFRTWTPDSGIVPIELTSAPFRPASHMSVVITGSERSPGGRIHAYLECEQNGHRLDIFRGSVNVNVAEAIVNPPRQWCPGNARLKFSSFETMANVGVGAVFEISHISYLKKTLFGKIPYFLVSIAIFSLVMVAGAALAVRAKWDVSLFPVALTSLGVLSLSAFFLVSSVGSDWRWILAATAVLAIGLVFFWSGREASIVALNALTPYAHAWILVGVVYFAISGLVGNGVGHWEPNYRFWPATWSSDNELPWMFAEALRHDWNMKGLFGGVWVPTDRPPLMTGAYLLLADVFDWLQYGNDGSYLRGEAYNAAALALNALWVPATWWLLTVLRPGIDGRGRAVILVFLGSLPFVLFNTIYGWPKAFGAAFSLVAFGLAWQSRDAGSPEARKLTIILFFVSGAMSMLAHASTALFLVPLGSLFLWWTLRRNARGVLAGFAIALALLSSWSLYKWLVLPSANPITKYALTGNYGFGHSDLSLWQMLADRYKDMTFWRWLDIKWTMLRQSFLPLEHPIARIGLNSDHGANAVDRLRAWDFMLLSKGNVAIPVFTALAVWAGVGAAVSGRREIIRNIFPYLALIGVSLAAWLLMIFGFLVPPVGPVWPQAALFGMALGGAVVVHVLNPKTFGVVLLATMAYTAAVWILSPLQLALRIDIGAALILGVLGAWALMSRYLPLSAGVPDVGRSMSSDSFSLDAVTAYFRENFAIQRLGNATVWTVTVRVITGGALVFATYIAVRYAQQPLADVHAFRQTQTALTSYWMLKEGWSLAYQTPVAGFPWSIPFEFPIYQGLVAVIAAAFGLELEPVGRLVSYAFLIACAWPAFAISRRLDLPWAVPWVFCALLWTAPLNVYWGRTFMIETAALFFSLACMPYGIDLIRREGRWRSAALFIVFGSGAVLQKITTGGPVLLFLLIGAVFVHVKRHGFSPRNFQLLIYPVGIIAVPLIIGWGWTQYTDVVKAANPFGRQMTSDILKIWNFGTIEQKLDIGTWRLVVWERSFRWNAAGLFGMLLLLAPWFGAKPYRRFAWLSLASIALFVLPVAIFTNVHFVHEYYQVACVPFLLGGLAIVIGGWMKQVSGTMLIVPITTAVIIISNLVFFNSTYGVVAARSIDELDPRSVQAYRVGRYLREHTDPGAGLVIFGQGYSSEIAFQAQRKSMTVPPWFGEYAKLWDRPQTYLGNTPLGAIVICPVTEEFPSVKDIQQRVANEPIWIHESVHGCEVLISADSRVLN